MVLALVERRGWGGRREGAGRRSNGKPGVPHRARQRLAARFPCHVTLKVRPGVPSLRSVRLVRELERSFAELCKGRRDFRLVHYSVQTNHAHFLVEAKDRNALGRGMKALGARLGRAANRTFGRCGPVLADRYHVRVLRTPRQVRNALRYVLLNARKHSRTRSRTPACDPASSGRWFDGWKGHEEGGEREAVSGLSPVSDARTWLLTAGWRRHGLIDRGDAPGGNS